MRNIQQLPSWGNMLHNYFDQWNYHKIILMTIQTEHAVEVKPMSFHDL